MQEPKELAKELSAQGAALKPEAAVAEAANIQLSLNNSGGYIALNWSNSGAVGKYDYVALFDHAPAGDAASYLYAQWQWVTKQNSPYVTGTSALGIRRACLPTSISKVAAKSLLPLQLWTWPV